MKKILLVALMISAAASSAFATDPPFKTLIEIQQVPQDSLLKADTIGAANSTNPNWTVQASRYNGQTVTVVVVVTVEPNYITYTTGPMAFAVADTGANGSKPWSGILVRFGGTPAQWESMGYKSIARGDIIQMQGTIGEFPSGYTNSLTQFAPDPTKPVAILSSGNPIPVPPILHVSDFNVGVNPSGKVKFSTGEQWEGKEVILTNLTVDGWVNGSEVNGVKTGRGTFSMVDDQGNQISDYDWSRFFTFGHGQSYPVAGDTSYHLPAIGTHIDTIRGYISTSSGQEAPRGYRICPIYPGDFIDGKIAPALTTHRRYPVMVTPDSAPSITAKVYRQLTSTKSGAALKTVKLIYSVNNGAWQSIDMTAPQPAKDSLYSAVIPKQSAGTLVKYFLRVEDVDSMVTMLCNNVSLTARDSSQGLFFYKVLDRSAKKPLMISDIQTTPFLTGYSSLVGAVDSVGGIVTADTSSLRLSPASTYATNPYYIQSGNNPYSGLWVTGPDSVMIKVALGDSIIVTGYINESYGDVTRIENVTNMRIVSRGNPLPAPVKLSTDLFASNTKTGEPYESMLVTFDNTVVTDVAPVYSDATEYEVSNGQLPILVRRDGKNVFSNVLADTVTHATILKVGDKLGSLTGVIFYSGKRYILVPRTNADFPDVKITSVQVEKDNAIPKEFSLNQNFPNPFNPSTNIRFTVAKSQLVTLAVYDVLGREVETLVHEQLNPGTYTVQWNAKNLSSGVYFYRLQSGNFVQTMKLMLMK